MSEEQNPFTVGRAFLATQPSQQDTVPLLEFPSLEEYRKKARAELRDRFAMAVVSGVYIHWRTSLDKVELGCNCEDIAMIAYDVADAMLKVREENSQ